MQHALVVSHCVLRKLGHCPWTILFVWFVNFSLKGFTTHIFERIVFTLHMKLPLEVVQINCAFHDDSLIFDDFCGSSKISKIWSCI